MKKDKFQLFLEQSKFISPILNEAKLNQVLVDLKTRKWVFDITLSDVIEPEVLFPFIQTLKSYFLVSRVHSGVDVQLHYQSLSAFEEHAMSYFDYAVIQLSKEKARFMVLKNFKARYEHKEYILSVDQDSTYLQEYFKDIISCYHPLIVDEEPGKASNQTFAARIIDDYVIEKNIDRKLL